MPSCVPSCDPLPTERGGKMTDKLPDERKRLLEEENCDEVPKRKKPRKESRKRRPGFDKEIYSETTYYIKNGLRYVKPYYFTFTTHAKGRWVGSKVIDVFSQEFQSESPHFYERAIQAGKITVNGQVATMDTVIGHNELVCHKVHRHEPPVSAQPLTLIHNDDHLVVLDKPPSIPVHPCGRYRHNSVVFLLGKEHNLKNLHTVHRLDRLTSGLLMFAKTVSKAQQLEVEIRERKVTKVYVCRVKGEFPSEPIECNEPILVVSHKLGVCRVDPTGKECSTHFKHLSFNGKSSVIQCVPKTGRMHQIRVHLQWLGFPIMNDPLYNHPAWKAGKDGDSLNVDHLISEIVKSNYTSKALEQTFDGATESELTKKSFPVPLPDLRTLPSTSNTAHVNTENASGTVESKTKICSSVRDTVENLEDSKISEEAQTSSEETLMYLPPGVEHDDVKPDKEGTRDGGELKDSFKKKEECKDNLENESQEGELVKLDSDVVSSAESATDGSITYDPDCTECRTVYPDPTPSELMMFLHALSYKGEGWEYSTAMPAWAQPDWEE